MTFEEILPGLKKNMYALVGAEQKTTFSYLIASSKMA